MNDKSYGGVFLTTDGGASWAQIAGGLEGRDVYTLAEAKDGTVLAGTNHGIFALVAGEGFNDPHWVMKSSIVNPGIRIVSEVNSERKKVNREEEIQVPARQLSSRVAAFDLSGDVWLATTSEGLFTSKDQGTDLAGRLCDGVGGVSLGCSMGWRIAGGTPRGRDLFQGPGKTWDPVNATAVAR